MQGAELGEGGEEASYTPPGNGTAGQNKGVNNGGANKFVLQFIVYCVVYTYLLFLK